MEKNIFAVVRYTPGMGWYIQNDVDHQSSGVASASLSASGLLRIDYNFTASKVGYLTLQPDNVLLSLGFGPAGAGVGLGASEFQLGRSIDISGSVSLVNGTPCINYPSMHGISCALVSHGVVRVTHPSVYPDVMTTQLTRRMQSGGGSIGLFAETFFDVHFDQATGAQELLFKRSGVGLWPASKGYPDVDGNYFLTGVMHV